MADRYKALHLAHHGPKEDRYLQPRYRREGRKGERKAAWRAAKRSAKAEMDDEMREEAINAGA